MVDDSLYIIVPNRQKGGSNSEGDRVAKAMLDGFRIIHKMSCRKAVHYVLIKFKEGTKPGAATNGSGGVSQAS